MDVRYVRGSTTERIAATAVGTNSGDGYSSANSGPVRLLAGDRIVTEVRQNSGSATVLQDYRVTFLTIQYLGP